MPGAMFDDIIEAFTDEEETRDTMAQVTPTPTGRVRNVNRPRIDTVHRDYLQLIAELKTSKAKETKAEDGELHRSVLLHISKLSESFLSRSQVKPQQKPRINMDLSIYPKILGKNWTITKVAFTSSIASAHGLNAALNRLLDDASEAAMLNHKSNCLCIPPSMGKVGPKIVLPHQGNTHDSHCSEVKCLHHTCKKGGATLSCT